MPFCMARIARLALCASAAASAADVPQSGWAQRADQGQVEHCDACSQEVENAAMLQVTQGAGGRGAGAGPVQVCKGDAQNSSCARYASKATLITPSLDPQTAAKDCGVVLGYDCDAPSWVFCQNARCSSELKQDMGSGAWYSECQCWQQTYDNGNPKQNSSILPVNSNSGANCVMGAGPGGEEMCNQIKDGSKLWSTYGPYGSFLPEYPPFTATCAPHTPWVWCWGAPCEEQSSGSIICKCPLMISMNPSPQSVSLPGDSLCADDPCNGPMLNSMPAGTSPAPLLDPASVCYDYNTGYVNHTKC